MKQYVTLEMYRLYLEQIHLLESYQFEHNKHFRGLQNSQLARAGNTNALDVGKKPDMIAMGSTGKATEQDMLAPGCSPIHLRLFG